MIYKWRRRRTKKKQTIRVNSREPFFFNEQLFSFSYTRLCAYTSIHTYNRTQINGRHRSIGMKKKVYSRLYYEKKNEGEVFLGLFNSFILHLLVQHLIRKLNGLPYGPQTGRFWNCWCLLHSDFFFFSNGLSIVSRAIVRQRRTATIVVLSSMSKSL